MLPTRQMYHNYTYMRANMLKIDVCYILTDFLGSYSRKIDLWLILLKKNSSSGFCTLQSNRAVSAEGTASSRPHRGSKRNIKKAWAENYQDLLHERSIAGGAYMLSDAVALIITQYSHVDLYICHVHVYLILISTWMLHGDTSVSTCIKLYMYHNR